MPPKAGLATTLQKNVAAAEHLPENSTSVVDGMNIVEKTKGDKDTFGDIATTILSMELKKGSQSNQIDVVFDIYQEGSIINSERSFIGEETVDQFQNITST